MQTLWGVCKPSDRRTVFFCLSPCFINLWTKVQILWRITLQLPWIILCLISPQEATRHKSLCRLCGVAGSFSSRKVPSRFVRNFTVSPPPSNKIPPFPPIGTLSLPTHCLSTLLYPAPGPERVTSVNWNTKTSSPLPASGWIQLL